MTIIEDIENISPLGKTICGVVFSIGIALLFIALIIGLTIPQKIKSMQSTIEHQKVFQSKPEELSYLFSKPLNAKTEDEKTQRQMTLETKLEDIEKNLNTKVQPPLSQTPSELLSQGVTYGFIHPQEAEEILQECNTMTAKRIGALWIIGDQQ